MNGKLYPTKCDDATKLNLALMLQQILLDENLTFLRTCRQRRKQVLRNHKYQETDSINSVQSFLKSRPL